MILGANIGDSGISQSEIRIQNDCVLEHLEREFQILPLQTAGVALATQVEVVGLEIFGWFRRDGFLFLRGQRDPQCLGDLAGDLVLHLENIFHLAIIALGPDRKIGAGVHQLRIDAQAAAGAAQAACQDVSRSQLLPNLCGGHLLVPVREHSRAREDVQAPDLGKFGNNVFRDAVAKVFVFLRPAEVLEIENGYGFRACFADSRPRFCRISRTLVTGINVTLEPDQVGLEIRGGLITQISVLFERLLHDSSKCRR